jgi:hypothetical protein
VSSAIPGKSRRCSVRVTRRPITSAYATAITAASVGVNTPEMIPPMMISGISRARMLRLRLRAIVRSCGKAPFS